MTNRSTTTATIDINGHRLHVNKPDILALFDNVDNWIKVPDFTYAAQLKHLVLDPEAHQAGHTYLLLPILESGVYGQVDPVLSSRGYLCRVEQSARVAWQRLDQSDKDLMVHRYPEIGLPDGSGTPEFIGISSLVLLTPVHDVLRSLYKCEFML